MSVERYVPAEFYLPETPEGEPFKVVWTRTGDRCRRDGRESQVIRGSTLLNAVSDWLQRLQHEATNVQFYSWNPVTRDFDKEVRL